MMSFSHEITLDADSGISLIMDDTVVGPAVGTVTFYDYSGDIAVDDVLLVFEGDGCKLRRWSEQAIPMWREALSRVGQDTLKAFSEELSDAWDEQTHEWRGRAAA